MFTLAGSAFRPLAACTHSAFSEAVVGGLWHQTSTANLADAIMLPRRYANRPEEAPEASPRAA